MLAMCLVKLCRDCDWYVMRGGKLDCNYNDRLGLGKPDITKMLATGEEEEKVEE